MDEQVFVGVLHVMKRVLNVRILAEMLMMVHLKMEATSSILRLFPYILSNICNYIYKGTSLTLNSNISFEGTLFLSSIF